MNEPPEIQKNIAIKVLTYAQAKDDQFSIDPFTIMAICNCIISIVKLLYMCYSKEGVAKVLKNKGIVHKLLLKREIRKHFSDKQQRNIVYMSMLDVYHNLSESELTELLDSAQE